MHTSQRSRSRVRLATVYLLAGIGAGMQYYAHADVDAGADSFDANCAECHSLKAGKNKKGPSLAGIVGRKAASIEDFSGYSDPMKASGITWTADKLDVYIKNPRELVLGGKMKFKGLPDETERKDLIEFLSQQK